MATMAARPELYLNGTLYCDWRVQVFDCFGDQWFPQLQLVIGVFACFGVVAMTLNVIHSIFIRKIPLVRHGQLSSTSASQVVLTLYFFFAALHPFLLLTHSYTSYVQREIMVCLPMVMLLWFCSIFFQGIMGVVASVNQFDINPKQVQGVFLCYNFQAMSAFLICAGVFGHFRDIGDGPGQSIAFRVMCLVNAIELILFCAVLLYAGQAFLKILYQEKSSNRFELSPDVKKLSVSIICSVVGVSSSSFLVIVMGFYPGSFLIPGLAIFFMVALLLSAVVFISLLSAGNMIRICAFPVQKQKESSQESTHTSSHQIQTTRQTN